MQYCLFDNPAEFSSVTLTIQLSLSVLGDKHLLCKHFVNIWKGVAKNQLCAFWENCCDFFSREITKTKGFFPKH